MPHHTAISNLADIFRRWCNFERLQVKSHYFTQRIDRGHIYTNLPVNAIVTLPHPQTTPSYIVDLKEIATTYIISMT